jgi:DNA-binding Lrp family transcriptional regulator
MDGTDLRILRELGFIPFARGPRSFDAIRPSHVAKALDLNPDLVKERMAKMESAGILAGWELYPNQRHLGLTTATYHCLVDASEKAKAIDALGNMEGITGVYDYVGPELCVDIFYRNENELNRRVGLIETLTKAHRMYRFYAQPIPPVERALTPLDWKIIRALRGRARRSLGEVAKELRISTRTVRRRVERMADEGSIYVLPYVDASRIRGVIPLGYAVHMSPTAPPGTGDLVRQALDENWLYCWVPPDPVGGSLEVAAFAHSPHEAEELRRQIAALPGVTGVEALFPSGAKLQPEWLDETIAARIEGEPLSHWVATHP